MQTQAQSEKTNMKLCGKRMNKHNEHGIAQSFY